MSTPTATTLFSSHSQYHLLICRQSVHAIQPSGIVYHLTHLPHRLPHAQARALRVEVETDTQWSDIQNFPLTLQTPVDGLTVFTDGLWCCHSSQCNYVCRDITVMRRYWRQQHSWNPTSHPAGGRQTPQKLQKTEDLIQSHIQRVCCQRFFKRAQGSQFIRITRLGAEYEPTPAIPTDEAIAGFPTRIHDVQDELREDQPTVVQAGEVREAFITLLAHNLPFMFEEKLLNICGLTPPATFRV